MNPTASAEEINLYVNSIKCKQTDTGAIVDNSNCGAIKKSPAYELRKIPAVMSPEFRKVHVTVADILAAAPDMDQAVANSLCSTWVRIAGITWNMSCDAPKNPAHYVRVAASLLDPDRHYSYSTPNAQYVNGSANADTITLSVYGTKCFDISSGNAVSTDVDNCAYLTSGPSHYDLVTIPATIVAELGTVYVERSELEAVLPYDGKAGNISSQATTVDGLCAAGYAGFPIAVGPAGSRQGFRFVCGTPEDPSNYARTIGQALDPYEFYPMGNYAVRDTNSNFQGTSYSFSVKSTICTNLATGADGGSKCDFKQDGPNIYDLLSIPASYVPEMREIYVQQSDLTAALGSGAAAYYNSSSQYKTVSQICSTGLERLKVGPSSNRQEWTMLCGDPVDPADFRRSATILGDPNDLFHPFDRTNQTANSDVNASEFKFSVYRTDCVNTRTGETHNPSRCDYLPTGLERYDIVGVPATFVPELREFYVDEAQLRTQLPSLTHIDDANSSGSDLASVCNGSENRFWVTGQNWKMYCGQADDPRRYADVASNLVDPKAEYRDSEYRKLNEDLSSGVYKFGVRTTKCIYKDTGASAPNAKCQYLTQDNAEIYDIVSIPVSYDVANKKIMVTRAALEAAMPHGASASRYDGNYKNVTQICNGELKNLKAGPVAADYWDMVCID